MSQIFPSTPQPYRAPQVQGPDSRLLVNPMAKTGLDEILKYQLGLMREKNRHDLAMQRSMMDMVTKFRPGGTRGNKVMGWHNPRQKRILEEADNSMYSAMEQLGAIENPTTQDILKFQRQIGESTTRALDQVAYEQSLHMKYLDKYNKNKSDYHAGAYNAALEEYYNWDGEEPFDVRTLDPSAYMASNPYDVADDFMERLKKYAPEDIEVDPSTGLRYVKRHAEGYKDGLREEIRRKSGQSLGWDYDSMSPEEKQAIMDQYPDRDSYINGMIESVVNTISPSDEFSDISEVKTAPRTPGSTQDSKYTKSHAAKIETIIAAGADLGIEISEDEALLMWEEILRMGKEDRYKTKTLKELIKIVSGKQSRATNPKSAAGSSPNSVANEKQLENELRVAREIESSSNTYSKSYLQAVNETIDVGPIELEGGTVDYNYGINPIEFIKIPFAWDEKLRRPISDRDKDMVRLFFNMTPFSRDKVVRLTDENINTFIQYMEDPDLARTAARSIYAGYLEKMDDMNIKGDKNRVLALFNWYAGDEKLVKEHLRTDKEDPEWVKQMSDQSYNLDFLTNFYDNTIRNKLGMVESGGKYDAVYSGSEWSSAIGKYQVLAYTRWRELVNVMAGVPGLTDYDADPATIAKLKKNPWIKSKLSGSGNIKMPDGRTYNKSKVLNIMAYFLENPEIQERHYKEYLEKPAFRFVDKMKDKYPDTKYNDDQLFYIFHHHGGCAEQFIQKGTTCRELLDLNTNAHSELLRALKKLG